MIFCSLNFTIFAAVFFLGWSFIRSRAPKTIAWSYLTVASLVFYGWWNWKNVFVLVAIAVANYACCLWIARTRYRRAVLALAITAALAPLIGLKYLEFLVGAINSAGDLLGLSWMIDPAALPHWPIPLGISFISMSAISYAIDVFTEEVAPTKNVVQHFSFLALFPVMIAGPIVRAGDMLPQLAELPPTTPDQRWQAMKLITYGLVKKCIVADHIAGFTVQMFDQMYKVPSSTGLWWFTAVLFAIQIYCDFSGYTDIARGLGRWIGLELPNNFNHPFLATSFADYWNRWNISFSTWLRDYIYFPLARAWGANRIGAIAAVMATFLVSGLWHGAAWTFVVWGIGHGLLVSVESVTHWDRHLAKVKGGRYLANLIVFAGVCVLLVVFRSNDLGEAWTILKTMFSFHRTEYSWITRDRLSLTEPAWLILPALFVIVELRHLIDFDSSKAAIAMRSRFDLGWLAIALLLLASVYWRGPAAGFIYAGF